MNDIDPHVLKLLRDIDTSSRRIISRLQGIAREEFIDPRSLDIQDIVARRLGIIGEAAAALYKKYSGFCEAHPEIPIRQARGMRNILIHDYDGVDWDIVWNTIKLALPELVESIKPLIAKDD